MTEEFEDLLYEVKDGVATITLNRPAQRNAMTADMRERLSGHLQQISNDPEIRVAIVTGAGGVFCAGADLKQRAASGGVRAEDASATTVLAPAPGARWSTLKVSKPLIAAIDGYCLAGGMELALACDIRICTPSAQFGLPEVVRGFFPGGGGPQRLVKAIPQSMAMEMLLTGDRIDAEAAARSGLVSRVVAAEDLMPTVRNLAKRIAGHAPLAVRTVKEVATAALDQTLEQSLRFGDTMRWVIGQTEDAKEGPRAFTEKREPRFIGR